MERLFFDGKERVMNRSFEKTRLEELSENLTFLADVFGEQEDKDIPNVPFLELARCFELTSPKNLPVPRHRSRRRSRWL